MVIRKQFRYEMGHIVRNAWSERCSKSFHGHSYVAEFEFQSNKLDDGGMVCDFGFLKKIVNPFVDSFDHASVLWNRPEDQHLVKFFQENFDRVIITEFSSTAELQAAMFYYFGKRFLQYLSDKNLFENGENGVKMKGVKVHETTTGWAYFDVSSDLTDANLEDVVSINNIQFSEAIQRDWPMEFKEVYNQINK